MNVELRKKNTLPCTLLCWKVKEVRQGALARSKKCTRLPLLPTKTLTPARGLLRQLVCDQILLGTDPLV